MDINTLSTLFHNLKKRENIMYKKKKTQMFRSPSIICRVSGGRVADIVSPTCPGSSPGSPPSGTCPEHLTRQASRRHPNQMPESPHLTPVNAEEQRFYSEPLPDDRASHPISKGEPRHPAEETHFGRLYLRSRSFGHYPQLVTIGEDGNVD